MSKNRISVAVFAAALGALLIIGALASLAFTPALQADDPILITVNSAAIAADANFSGHVWGRYTGADLFYAIDQGTSVNTTSLELEISPDGAAWYNSTLSPTLLSANAADASGYVAELPIHGWQWRIVANVSNTETVTPVLSVILRNE